MSTTTSPNRLISLDVFRGLTIATMVMVNNPGSWNSIYWPLEHAEWNGWTPTDLVFPFFLFIVGVSITLAFGQRVEVGGTKRDLYLKVVRRTLVIFGLGLFLNGFPYYHLSEIRIPGVLQRIAVCYFFASIIFLTTKIRTQVIIALALLIVYWLLMTHLAAPGFVAGDLSKEGSLASFIDRVVFGPHIWKQGKVYDPEGILSTIPAIATALFGVLTGHWLRSNRSPYEKVAGMFVLGAACLMIGWSWNPCFPINKALWTRVGVGLMARLIGLIKVPDVDGTKISLQEWIYQHLFLSWSSPVNASLAFAICFILVWLGLMWLLYQRKVVIKV